MSNDRQLIATLREQLEQAHARNAELTEEVAEMRVAMKEKNQTYVAALHLFADIRAAAGAPEGKLMRDELVRHIADMRKRLEGGAE